MSRKTSTRNYRFIIIPSVIIIILFYHCQQADRSLIKSSYPLFQNGILYKGAIIRTDTTQKNIALVFTAHEFAEGYDTIIRVLRKHNIKASFFLTGDFYRNSDFSDLISELSRERHYLGAHSDKHLLYASWENRDSLLVTKEEFIKDLKANYFEMEKFRIPKDSARLFLPPYEWYNDTISSWCKEIGITLVNFSPGTIANHDWTIPEPGSLYFSSDSIYNNIVTFAESENMNGFILLMHLGTDPRRTDKFYFLLDSLVSDLKIRGYQFPLLRDLVY